MQTELVKGVKRTEVEVQDGKLTMNGGGHAKLSLKAAERRPLGSNEPVAKLVLSGEDFRSEVPLGHIEAADLAERLDTIASGGVWDDD